MLLIPKTKTPFYHNTRLYYSCAYNIRNIGSNELHIRKPPTTPIVTTTTTKNNYNNKKQQGFLLYYAQRNNYSLLTSKNYIKPLNPRHCNNTHGITQIDIKNHSFSCINDKPKETIMLRYYSSDDDSQPSTVTKLSILLDKVNEMEDKIVWEPTQVDKIVHKVLESDPSWNSDIEACKIIASLPISKTFAKEIWSILKEQNDYIDSNTIVDLAQSVGFDPELLQEILDRCYPTDVKRVHLEIWSNLLHRLSKYSDLDEALELFDFMLSRGFKPNEQVMRNLSETIFAAHSINRAIQLIDSIIQGRLPLYSSSIVCLVELLIKYPNKELEAKITSILPRLRKLDAANFEYVGNALLRANRMLGSSAVLAKLSEIQQVTENQFITRTFTHIHVINSFNAEDKHEANKAYKYFYGIVKQGTQVTVSLANAIISKLVEANHSQTLDLFVSLPRRIATQPKILSKVLRFCGETGQAKVGYELLKNHMKLNMPVDKGLQFSAVYMCVIHPEALPFFEKVIKILVKRKTVYKKYHSLCLSVLRRAKRLGFPHCFEIYQTFVDSGVLIPNTNVLAVVLQVLLEISPEKAPFVWKETLKKKNVRPNAECYGLYAACIDAADEKEIIQDPVDRIYSLFENLMKTKLKPQHQFVGSIIRVLVRHHDTRIQKIMEKVKQGSLPTPADKESRDAIQKAQAEHLTTYSTEVKPLTLFT